MELGIISAQPFKAMGVAPAEPINRLVGIADDEQAFS